MKGLLVATVALFCVLAVPTHGVRLRSSSDKTIGKIVKLLQEMMQKNKETAEKERVLYAKYRCYVDTNTKEKKENIEKLTEQIALLESEVEALQGENALLSTEIMQLQTEITANEQARSMADALRKQQADAFALEEADLQAALAQMDKAVDVLSAMGADKASLLKVQSNVTGSQSHATGNLRKVEASVKEALVAVNALLTPSQQQTVSAFLQEKENASRGSIVEVLKSLKDMFDKNLENAQAAEKRAKETHDDFIATKKSEWDTMDEAHTTKKSKLAGNDLSIGTKKGEHATAVQQKADDEAFLESLTEMAETKAKEYDARTMYRQNEAAAISEAIAILDSDKAFDTFGKVKATTTGATALLQLRSRDVVSALQAVRRSLQEVARATHSKRLAGVAQMMMTNNPYKVILVKIDEIKEVINKEGEVDKEQKEWCESEVPSNEKSLDDKKTEITALEGDITDLEDKIENPKTGLKALIQQSEEDLELNQKNQGDETTIRTEDNRLYQASADDASEAAVLLGRAIAALEKYYSDLDDRYKKEVESGFVQEDPAPPDTWTADTYTGESGQGNKVIDMLKYVLTETEKEGTAIHDDELTDQHAYEDSMSALKKAEENLENQIVTQKKDLADAEEELEAKKEELAQTEKEKAAIEKYLSRINPGCDFIKKNYADREAARAKELAALDTAVTKLKATPGFAKAAEEEENDKLGECKDACVRDGKDHASCKACLAGASVPSYCASHPSATGC